MDATLASVPLFQTAITALTPSLSHPISFSMEPPSAVPAVQTTNIRIRQATPAYSAAHPV
jgi:hypothetical protein